MSGTSGTVALVDNSTALTCKTAADCAADADIVDLVGYGTAVVHEGSADAPGLSNTTSAQRITTTDTDQNGTDFTAAAPTPGAPNAGEWRRHGGGGTPGPLAIHDIQGTGLLSPQAGNTVTNVPGIVTGVRATGSSKGYWIQDPNPDSNPATSEGIFVFTSSAPTVAAGDSVLVSGKVQEYYPLASGDTVATTSNLSITEIDQTGVSVLSSGNALPAPIVLARPPCPTPTRRTWAAATSSRPRSSRPARPWTSTSRSRACGSRWTTPGSSGPSDSFGEQYITTKPSQDVRLPRRHPADGRERHPVRAAGGRAGRRDQPARSTSATCSPARRSARSTTRSSAATSSPPPRSARCRTTTWPRWWRPRPAKKQLSIATYNVENLAPSDPDSKFTALAQGIVTNLAAPDIIAVEEVQDNDGATDDGVVAADQTIEQADRRRSSRPAARTTTRARSTRSTTRTAASPAATSGSCSCTTRPW